MKVEGGCQLNRSEALNLTKERLAAEWNKVYCTHILADIE